MQTIFDHQVNLKAKMAKMTPQEGLNYLHTFRIGSLRIRLAALVKNSRIIDWVTVDSAGKQTKSTGLQLLEKKKGRVPKITCWRCVKDENGDIHCVEVECPKGDVFYPR